MTDTQPTNNLDPQLKKLMELVRAVPARDPQAVNRGRARFYAELKATFPRRSLFNMSVIKHTNQPRSLIPAFAIRAAVALVMVMAVLFSGAGITALAAQNALPGDVLYPVKTGLEDLQAALTFGDANKIELQLSYAEYRVEELADLIDEPGSNKEIASDLAPALAEASAQFRRNINKAAEALGELYTKDPAQAVELASKLNGTLDKYGEKLAEIKTSLPEVVQGDDVEYAQFTSQVASNLSSLATNIFEFTGTVTEITLVDEFTSTWLINGLTIYVIADVTDISEAAAAIDLTANPEGVEVIVQVLLNADNTLTAREIQLASEIENRDDGLGPEFENNEQNLNANRNNDEEGDPGHELEQEMEQEAHQERINEPEGSAYRHGDELEIIGTIDEIVEGETLVWIVDGLPILVTLDTQITLVGQDLYAVGDEVKILFVPQEDGTLLAISILPANSDDGSQYRYQPGSQNEDDSTNTEDKPGPGK